MWFKLDIYKLGLQLLPSTLRGKRLFAVLSVLLLPFYLIWQALALFREQSLSKVNVTGQVIYLEKVLNDEFLLHDKEIYITDANVSEKVNGMIYPDSVNTMLVYDSSSPFTAYLETKGDGRYEGDFVVNVPSYLSIQEAEIRGIIDYNKPAGRRYTINFYSYE